MFGRPLRTSPVSLMTKAFDSQPLVPGSCPISSAANAHFWVVPMADKTDVQCFPDFERKKCDAQAA